MDGFTEMLCSERGDFAEARCRYDEGLRKLVSAEDQASVLFLGLEDLWPVLGVTSVEAAPVNAKVKMQFLEACAAPALQAGRFAQAEDPAFFTELCHRNLRVVLEHSPMGAASASACE